MRIVIFCLAVLQFSGTSAQWPDYFVDLLKGEITISKAGGKDSALRPKSLVYKNDIITLQKEGARATLVNRDGQYIILDKPGRYKVSGLAARPKIKSTGITEKYFHLIWEELENPAKSPGTGVENMIASWGGVIRGNCDGNMFPFDGWITAADSIRFTWSGSGKMQLYNFSLVDETGNPFLELQVRDSQLVIRSTGLRNDAKPSYGWIVQPVAGKCDGAAYHKFEWITPELYAGRVKKILENIASDGTSWYYLNAAEKLYSAHFYNLAAEYLRKTVSR